MATQVPASFLANYVANKKGGSRIVSNTPAPQAAPNPQQQQNSPAPVTPVAKPAKTPSPKPKRNPAAPAKKKPGFVKGILGAWAKEALGGSGHLGRHIARRLSEDEGGGVPINNASSGAVAGLGTSRDGSQGEPGVDPRRKKKKTPLLTFNMFNRTRKLK